MAAAKKRGLGRGLDTLLGGGGDDHAGEVRETLQHLPVGALQPGKYQPRQTMDADKLEELAASIKAQGVIEPVVVRAIAGGRYELIAGERRWRATQLAGMAEIPALVREVDDRAVVAIALIENIQREELSPLEEAVALKRLGDEFRLSHGEVAEAVGRSRAAVSNLLRLLDLPAEIKAMLEKHEIEMGHARALLTLPPAQALALARKAAELGWSVRELEDAARASQPAPKGKAKKAGARDANVESLERDLSEKLGARVVVAHGSQGRGKLTIHYHSLDELDGIIGRIR